MSKKIFLFVLLSSLLFLGCEEKQSITIYVSEDQVFSEPLLKDFEKERGIRVNAIYDTEESKSTGVMNRLIAEKHNPQADLYWANEPIRAEILRQKDILTPYQSPSAQGIPRQFIEKNFYWTGFSARMRLFIVKKGLKEKPSSILDYNNIRYKGETVIANPLFGTTTSHISALFTLWGKKRTELFLKKLKQNKTDITTSNGESADLVASKKALFSLVDSDDAIARFRSKKDIEIVYPDQKEGELGLFVVPNTLMLIKNSPHPQLAKELMDYLLSSQSEAKLALADCAQIPLHKGVPMPKELKPISQIKIMNVDYAQVAKKMVDIQPYLKKFLENYHK